MKQSKRRKQQRERASWQEANPSARGLRGPAGADEMADELILAAAHVDCEGSDDGTHLRCLIDALAQGMGLEGGRDLVARRLDSLLQSDIARVLDSGWAPHAITRVVRHRAGARAASIMAGPLAEAASGRHRRGGGPVSTARQAKNVRKLDYASSSWKADLSTAIAALSVLEYLPVLPDLGGIRSSRRNVRSHEEQRMFTRIRGLLTKAESSDYAEEADAFMAKAQELMSRYCIDRTMVEADAEGGGVPQVDARRVWLEDPYLEAKALLLANVASSEPMSGRCRSGIGFLHPARTSRGPRRNGLALYVLARAGYAAYHGSREGSGVRPALPEAVVPPIFLRGVCRKDRFSAARSQRGRDRGGRQRVWQPPAPGARPAGGRARCRRRGSVRRIGRAEILTHGCRGVGGRHGSGRHGRARGPRETLICDRFLTSLGGWIHTSRTAVVGAGERTEVTQPSTLQQHRYFTVVRPTLSRLSNWTRDLPQTSHRQLRSSRQPHEAPSQQACCSASHLVSGRRTRNGGMARSEQEV